MTLQQFIIIFGCIQLLLCQVGGSTAGNVVHNRSSANKRHPPVRSACRLHDSNHDQLMPVKAEYPAWWSV